MAFCFGFRSFFCARVIRARRHILLFYSLFSSWPLWPILSHNLLNNLIPVIMLPVVMWLVQRTDSYWLFSLVNDCSLLLYSGSPVLRYVLSPPIAVWLNWFPLTILVRSFFYRVLRVLCLLLKAPLFLFFGSVCRKPVFRIHIIFVVTLFAVARPRGLSAAVYRGNLYSYKVNGPVIPINFTRSLF